MMRVLSRIRPSSKATSHMIRFVMYNLVGALLPLLISWTVRRIGDVLDPPGAYAPELLFFAVMISATALGDLTDEKELGGQPVFQLMKGTLLFGAIVVAAIFGVHQYDIILGPGNLTFRTNITSYALLLAIALFVTSMVAEMLIARIRGAAQASPSER